MKTVTTLFGCLILAAALAAHAQTPPAATTEASAGTHRYIVERTFKPGSLDGLDAALKAKVNANNAKYDVHWVMSYANAEKTKTYCVYEGPTPSWKCPLPCCRSEARTSTCGAHP
jgi:Protein of unknown function (DUF4242)